MSKKASKKSKPAPSKKVKAAKPAKRPKAAKSVKAAKSPKAAAPAKKAAPSTAGRDRAIAQLKFARGTLEKFSKGFADNQVTAQAPGIPNHLLWTLGHLAATSSWIKTLIDGRSHIAPANYETLFGMGSKPVDDPSAYPAFADVRKVFDEAHNAIVAVASSMTDEELSTPPTADSGNFVTDKMDALFKCAWHEGWHLGQLADLRRALGLPSALA